VGKNENNYKDIHPHLMIKWDLLHSIA